MQIVKETRMNTEIQTIGTAIIIQNIVKWAAIIGLVWLALSFVDGWVMTALGASQ